MPNYQNGKIYSIRSHQTDLIYIGSTTQKLANRIGQHKKMYKKYLNGNKSYYTSFKILEYDDAYIELIKLYPCTCKSELDREEGLLIRTMNCVNKCIAGRSAKQYREDNKEKKKQYDRKYYNDNKEKIKKYKQQKIYCECGSVVRIDNLPRHQRSKKHIKFITEKCNDLIDNFNNNIVF